MASEVEILRAVTLARGKGKEVVRIEVDLPTFIDLRMRSRPDGPLLLDHGDPDTATLHGVQVEVTNMASGWRLVTEQ